MLSDAVRDRILSDPKVLDRKSVESLRSIARDCGLTGYTLKKKNELVEAIIAAVQKEDG